MNTKEHCKHCKRRVANAARGLCKKCYDVPLVRELYQPKRKNSGRRGELNVGNDVPPLPPEPTSALPGSEEKVSVMAMRAAAGFATFHPDDAKVSDTTIRHDFKDSPSLKQPRHYQGKAVPA